MDHNRYVKDLVHMHSVAVTAFVVMDKKARQNSFDFAQKEQTHQRNGVKVAN